MMATAMAAAEKNSNVSALTTVATRLVYNTPVRAFAEEWWHNSDTQITGAPNSNTAKDESKQEDTEEVSVEVSGGVSTERPTTTTPTHQSQKKGRPSNHANRKATEKAQDNQGRNSPISIRSSSKSSESDSSESDEDSKSDKSDDRVCGGAKSQQPNVVTLTHSQRYKPTLEMMRLLMRQNARAMRKMVAALSSTNKTSAGATGALASKLSTTRRTVLTACAGHDDNKDFVLPLLYTELEAASFTLDAIRMALRRLCVQVRGSPHKCLFPSARRWY